jgi:hypothetical protein
MPTSCHDFGLLRWAICPVCPAQTRDITSLGRARTWVPMDPFSTETLSSSGQTGAPALAARVVGRV